MTNRVLTDDELCPCCFCPICVCPPKSKPEDEKRKSTDLVTDSVAKDGAKDVVATDTAGDAAAGDAAPGDAATGGDLGSDISCLCLPGLCVCPGKDKKPVIKEISSCSCLHEETIHFISPAESEEYEPTPTMYSEETPCPYPRYQRTLAIIKPHAMQYKDVVLRAIRKSGLDIISARTIHLTPEQVAELYEKFYGSPIFPVHVAMTSISPVLVLSLAGIHAVRRWRELIGAENAISQEWFFPAWIRREYGLHGDLLDTLHASSEVDDAEIENRYFFPDNVLEPILDTSMKIECFLYKYVYPTLRDGLAAVIRNKPRDPILFLAEWLVTHNPYHPPMPAKILMENL